LEQEFGQFYEEEIGRPGIAIRVMAGLHYLKHLYNESDERVVEKYVENPYWQYFCGREYFEHELPCHPTALVKWRQRVGVKGIERMLAETLKTAQRTKQLKKRELERVNVDTTVPEKAIAYPTDARLYQKARRTLVKAAQRAGIELRQSYERVGKRTLDEQARYAAARQMKRAAKKTRRLRTILGSVIRDIERKCPEPEGRLKTVLEIARRIFEQKRDDKQKVYSVHASEVECIGKGKVRKPYEFGCKVSIVTTSKQCWVVGIEARHGNPYDGSTLKGAIVQMERLSGSKPKEAFVDRGYRGNDHHPDGVDVYLSGRRGLSPALKKHLRRRSAIEPVIGHVKADHRMDRNYLLGRDGDRINALLCGCGWNLRKLWRIFFLFIFGQIVGHNESKSADFNRPIQSAFG
jgi:IS5 family transposase